MSIRFTRATTTALAFALLGLAACGDAEMEEIPETAEVETEEMGPGLELDEELMIGADDVGETMLVNGFVAGTTADGFFIRTEADRVIFVESNQPVNIGDAVRVTGVVTAATVTVFEGWEAEAFDTGVEAEWDVIGTYYIGSAEVTPL